MSAKLIAAAREALVKGSHEFGCPVHSHWSVGAPPRAHSRQFDAWHQGRLATQPACDCYLSRLAAALEEAEA